MRVWVAVECHYFGSPRFIRLRRALVTLFVSFATFVFSVLVSVINYAWQTAPAFVATHVVYGTQKSL